MKVSMTMDVEQTRGELVAKPAEVAAELAKLLVGHEHHVTVIEGTAFEGGRFAVRAVVISGAYDERDREFLVRLKEVADTPQRHTDGGRFGHLDRILHEWAEGAGL